MINLNEAVQKIKQVGGTNVRAVPMSGQSVQGGQFQIEVKEGGAWSPIVSGVSKKIAEDIINQAINRVILG